MPYSWLFPNIFVAIYHCDSGTAIAALHVGVLEIIFPFILNQFYWAKHMNWIGVALLPLTKMIIILDNNEDSIMEAPNLVWTQSIWIWLLK